MPECLQKAVSSHEGPREPYNWSRYALAEFATVSQGYTFSRDYQGKTDGRWQYFKVADIGLETNGKYLEKAINSIDDETIQLIGCRPFPKGSIVFPRVGAALLNNNKKVLAQDSIVDDNVLVLSIVNPDICDFEYLYYALQQVQLANWCNSSLVPVINSKTVLKHKIVLPPIEEQRRIAEILSTQDKIIDLYGRKIKGLQRFKKGALSKMFPKPGHYMPEIRFTGFSDSWEQRKFSDLYEKVTEKNDLSFGMDKVISVANMYYKEDVTKSEDNYLRTYNVMRLGDIAFEGNKSKDYAHGRFVENTIGDGIVSHVFDVFRPIREYDLLFWKYLINYEGIMGRIMVRCTKASTMMTNLVANDFLKESIVVPSIAEQKQIGSFLESIDHLITLHQRKRDEEIRKKKALMQLLMTGIRRTKT